MPETQRNIASFSSAPNGWRVAIADTRDKELIIAPIVGWACLTSDAPYAHMGDGDLDPLVLWNNLNDPFVSLLSQTLDDWGSGSDKGRHHVHEILPPEHEPSQVPEGWSVRT
ncbi:hypothetical protein [Streptomyces cinnamoneus]|uniref:Uncharacterized protein n=1 Tax=Streptomyces cinnamoneus TaxID=53446 RepID=A0A918TKX8_STRCJ|nr:hypothetical protein [Streptomyces cinnamoneus]GHC52419.1 hypothetical protein GCM10010507_30700 [Streptomyces cinnamoneus]